MSARGSAAAAVHQPASGSGAAAAAVERKPIPPGGLTMRHLGYYNTDEVEAELRALGIEFEPATSDYNKKND